MKLVCGKAMTLLPGSMTLEEKNPYLSRGFMADTGGFEPHFQNRLGSRF